MPDNQDYRQYLEKCFKSIEDKLDAIVEQTTRTNARVNKLEDTVHQRQTDVDDFRNLEKDYGCVKKDVADIKADLEEYRLFKKHPTLGIILVVVFVFTIGISALQTIKSVTNSEKNDLIMQKMKEIEYKLIDVYGINPRTRGLQAYPDTSKKVNNINK